MIQHSGYLSPHFTLAEFTTSQTAIRRGVDNTPDQLAINAMVALCERVLEPLRLYLGRPIVITSGYRRPALNALIGGSTKSQHCQGEAADLIVPGRSVHEVVATIRKLKLPFDQLIDEFSADGAGWVHVSHSPDSPQRGEVLIARRINNRTEYEEDT